MNIEKFTLKAWEALSNAQSLAINSSHSEIWAFHLLFCLLQEKESLFPSMFKKLELNQNALNLDIQAKLDSLPKVSWDVQTWVNSILAKVLTLAETVSKKMWDEFISMEHLLISILQNSIEVKEMFEKYWATISNVEKVILEIRWNEKVTDNNPEWKFQALEKYTIDLTAKAAEWKADPIIWRDEEVRRAIQIISRRTKNNPVLVWDAWVWKTAIAEGLAQRIIAKDVPETLIWKKLLSLDMWALIAWAKFRWEFEERLKAVLKEVKNAEGQIILFIDEIHTIVWAWKGEWAMDAWNLIKPALARWELHCIWATTLNEYRLHIEKDPALERRFQPVMVNEPNEEDAIAILRWIKEKYEIHHWISITDSAIQQAVKLSTKYLPDRRLPDKAIDLMDEAASALRMELESQPEEIDDLQRKILRLEVERQSIKKEWKDKPRFVELEKDLASHKEKLNSLMAKWNEEKKSVNDLKSLREELESANQKAEVFKREWKYDMLAELQYGKIPEIKKKLKALEEKEKSDWDFVKEVVTEEEIAKIVSHWTWIPVTRLQTTETDKLLRMEDDISKSVVGQKEAVKAISNAIRRSRTWLSDENKPIWSFLFLWPTWVWKTEVAKVLAEFLFDSKEAMSRFDMSEYMEKHAVSKLIGSPPWYVWYDEGGRLTELVRRRPYSVILFDEVEKAHPDVFNLLLQILDDWRLTDSKWRTVNFKNTIIIMTSNIWSHEILKASEQWKKVDEEQVHKMLFEFFRPEFLNRIDEQIIFHALSPEDINSILEIALKEIEIKLKVKWIKLSFTKEAKEFLWKISYDPSFWARPMKRVLKRELLDKLALLVLEGDMINDIKVDYDGKLTFLNL